MNFEILLNHKPENQELTNIQHTLEAESKDIYKWMSENLSEQEKINLANAYYENIAEKTKTLLDRYLNDFQNDIIKTDSRGRVRTVSLRAWIKKNNIDGIISLWDIGCIKFCVSEHIQHSTYCNIDNKYYIQILNVWVKRITQNLLRKEKEYFNANDERTLKEKEIVDFMHTHNVWLSQVGVSGSKPVLFEGEISSKNRELTLSELNQILELNKDIKKYIEEKLKTINLVF